MDKVFVTGVKLNVGNVFLVWKFIMFLHVTPNTVSRCSISVMEWQILAINLHNKDFEIPVINSSNKAPVLTMLVGK